MSDNFVLKDIEVLTVGLVPMGANQEKFFLLKSEEDFDMSTTETVIEEAPVEQIETETPQAEIVSKENIAALVQEAVRAALAKKDEPADQPEPTSAPASDDVSVRITALQKANETLLERLEKSERAFAAEREARERNEFVAKAKTFSAVPVKSEDLAEQLHFLYKTDKKRFEFWNGVLTALTKEVEDGDFFAEIGGNGGAESASEKLDRLAKSGSIEDIKKALLEVSDSDAGRYLASRRAAITGRK